MSFRLLAFPLSSNNLLRLSANTITNATNQGNNTNNKTCSMATQISHNKNQQSKFRQNDMTAVKMTK